MDTRKLKETLTPKEAFDLGVQMEQEKKQRIKEAEEEAKQAYQKWQWEFLEVDEVKIK